MTNVERRKRFRIRNHLEAAGCKPRAFAKGIGTDIVNADGPTDIEYILAQRQEETGLRNVQELSRQLWDILQLPMNLNNHEDK